MSGLFQPFIFNIILGPLRIDLSSSFLTQKVTFFCNFPFTAYSAKAVEKLQQRI